MMGINDKIYCIDCKKLTKHTPKLSAIISGNLVCTKCSRMNGFCTLIKVGDESFNKQSKLVKWVEFENGFGKTMHDKPKIGYSLIMSPFNDMFTWITTPITEIIVEKNNFINFKSENSEYKLYNNSELSKKYD